MLLYGKPKELFGVEDLLNSNMKVENVSAFEHFPEVREYLARHNVDMVMLDADDNAVGWQCLAEKFKKINKQIKVVLLSCNKDDAVRAYEAGVFDYLLKPVKKKQLERVVAKT